MRLETTGSLLLLLLLLLLLALLLLLLQLLLALGVQHFRVRGVGAGHDRPPGRVRQGWAGLRWHLRVSVSFCAHLR